MPYIVRKPINIFFCLWCWYKKVVVTQFAYNFISLKYIYILIFSQNRPFRIPRQFFSLLFEIDQFHPWLVWQSTRKLNCFWTSKWVSTPFPTWKKILICSPDKQHTCPFPQYKSTLKNSFNWKIYGGKKLYTSQENALG